MAKSRLTLFGQEILGLQVSGTLGLSKMVWASSELGLQASHILSRSSPPIFGFHPLYNLCTFLTKAKVLYQVHIHQKIKIKNCTKSNIDH